MEITLSCNDGLIEEQVMKETSTKMRDLIENPHYLLVNLAWIESSINYLKDASVAQTSYWCFLDSNTIFMDFESLLTMISNY